MPSKSKDQFKFFEEMKEHPEEAKAKGISDKLIYDYTDGMNKNRWKKLREKVSPKKKII